MNDNKIITDHKGQTYSSKTEMLKTYHITAKHFD